jgi:hypothetical protein
MIEACALIYCSQTIDPDPATADGDDLGTSFSINCSAAGTPTPRGTIDH